MIVSTYKYKLKPRFALNAIAAVEDREGALLRVQFSEDLVGYADLFPWVELGDQPLADQLWTLKTGAYTEAVQQSLYLARLDAEARSVGRTLFQAHTTLRNHYLITDLNQDLDSMIEFIQAGGFQRVKVKMGHDLLQETLALGRLLDGLSETVQLRLDFNCSLDFEEFEAWLPSLDQSLKAKIEYFEDPFPYHADFWKALSEAHNVTLALDHAADPMATLAVGAGVVVLKPAKQNIAKIIELLKDKNKKFVFSHSMDHPVGRMGAISTAMYFKELYPELVLECGLNDFGIYEEDDFSKGLIATSYRTCINDEGSGVGFDQQLEGLTWNQWI